MSRRVSARRASSRRRCGSRRGSNPKSLVRAVRRFFFLKVSGLETVQDQGFALGIRCSDQNCIREAGRDPDLAQNLPAFRLPVEVDHEDQAVQVLFLQGEQDRLGGGD